MKRGRSWYWCQDPLSQLFWTSWGPQVNWVPVVGKSWATVNYYPCSCSGTKWCLTLCSPKDCSQASLSFTISLSLLNLMSIESVMPSNHFILCHSHLLLPSVFQASESFPVNCLFASGGQSIGLWASASVLPMNIQGSYPLGLTGFISLQSKGLSRVFCNTTGQKHQFFGAQPSLWSNSHIHTWLLETP